MTASPQELADQLEWTLVTLHAADSCEILRGDPDELLGIRRADLSDGGLAARVVGGPLSPAPWSEACDSSLYLLRDSQGQAQWVESRSKQDATGALVVCTRLAGPTGDLGRLALLSRLTLAGSLLGPLAHEVNNLVQGLSSAVYLFRDCLENGEPVELEDVEQLGEAVKELQGIGAEVQGFARLTLRGAEPLNLSFIIEQGIRLLTSMGKLKTVEVSLDLAEDLPTLHFPAIQIDTLVLALLNNAAEACLESPKAQQHLRVVARAEDEGVVVEVFDCGGGFVLKDQAVPFVSSKSPHRNIGIGLSAVSAILATHGGGLSTTYDEQGSCVRMFLPLQS